MSLQFLIHIMISSCIFALIASGFRFFIKLKGTIDFSYLGIVIFGTYTTVLLHIHLGWGILLSTFVAFVFSLVFTLLVLALSARLHDVYFAIGTLAFYLLIDQLANNMDAITGGAMWLSDISRTIWTGWTIYSLESYFVLVCVVVMAVVCLLLFFVRSYLYRILQARGENIIVVRSLWINITYTKVVLIVFTTFLAVVWWSLYAFYYQFIDPKAFWIWLVTLLLAISFLSYNMSYLWLFGVSFGLTFIYEYWRLFKMVSPGDLWYIREWFFALLVMVAAWIVFRRWSFYRNQ